MEYLVMNVFWSRIRALHHPTRALVQGRGKALGCAYPDDSVGQGLRAARCLGLWMGFFVALALGAPAVVAAADVYGGVLTAPSAQPSAQGRPPINVITDPQYAGTSAAPIPAPDAGAYLAPPAPNTGAYAPAYPAGGGVGQLASGPVPLIWQPLLERLAADGISGADVNAMFASLGEVASQDPMGRKVRELYMKSFVYTPPDPNAPKKPRLRLYKGVVTAENAARCRLFLQQHAASFARAEQRYGVPPEIAVALLFVETRLGTSVGKERALYTLASMARSTTPDTISTWLPQLPGYEQHLDWMQELMPKRADWAYKELRALVVHVREHGIEPSTVPGSIYGAVGLCQFMPSNLVPYGADGDDDGVIDLFTVPDAVESLSNYLAKHGWKKGITRERQHALLKTYNRVDIYANTIMALGDMVAGRTLPLPTDSKGKAKPKPKAKAQ